MKKGMLKGYFYIKNRVDNFLREESGEASLIAIILVIVVVIALAGIFRDELTKIVTDLIDRIRASINGF